MVSSTPMLDLVKPKVNGPETANTWGIDLNDNFDKIDAWAGPLPDRLDDLETGLAATVEEAPNDGQAYARQSETWLPLDLTVNWPEILGIPATFPPGPHNHPISDVTGLQPALDGKAPTVHTHAITDVTGLQSALDLQAQRDTAQDGVINSKAAG